MTEPAGGPDFFISFAAENRSWAEWITVETVAEAAAVKQFGLEPAPKRFSVGVIIAVTAPTHALHGLVTSY